MRMFEKIDELNVIVRRCAERSFNDAVHGRKVDQLLKSYREELALFNNTMMRSIEISKDMEKIAKELMEITETITMC